MRGGWRPCQQRQPFGYHFKLAEGARRLGQARVAGADSGAGLAVRFRHVPQECADIVEGPSGERFLHKLFQLLSE